MSLVMLSAQRSAASCDSTGADAGDVAAARAAVALHCVCAGAVNHGQYVKCASEQAKATLMNQSYRGAVTKSRPAPPVASPGSSRAAGRARGARRSARRSRVPNDDELRGSGHYIVSNALKPTSTATTVVPCLSI
jgi:hypothetical protein